MSGRRVPDAIDLLHAGTEPASGGVVMGTGIVSVALAFNGLETLSRVLLVIAAFEWIALGLLLADRSRRDPSRLWREARTPGALTGVAATAVLGTRLTPLDGAWAGAALLVMAAALWCVLIAPALWRLATPTVGVSLMLAVSTEALAELAATIADHEHEQWLLDAALAPCALGLVFYVLVMARFDWRQLAIGRGDQWVTGGALAISALAAGRITLADGALRAFGAIQAELELVVLMLWCAAVAWLPVLLATELTRPRLRYDTRRWSTVFPIGMYAACSYVVGATEAAPAITEFARLWTWAAVAAWLLVTAAMLCHGLAAVRLSQRRRDGARS